jgi:hypothetical protein
MARFCRGEQSHNNPDNSIALPERIREMGDTSELGKRIFKTTGAFEGDRPKAFPCSRLRGLRLRRPTNER